MLNLPGLADHDLDCLGPSTGTMFWVIASMLTGRVVPKSSNLDVFAQAHRLMFGDDVQSAVDALQGL